jgi:hypothetical protein
MMMSTPGKYYLIMVGFVLRWIIYLSDVPASDVDLTRQAENYLTMVEFVLGMLVDIRRVMSMPDRQTRQKTT